MQCTLNVNLAPDAISWGSDCVGNKKLLSAKEKLSTDALIWKIVKLQGPIPLKDIVKRVRKNSSTVWRNMVLLEEEELIRQTEPGSKVYVPFEWSDAKVAVKEALGRLKERWSQVTTYRVASEAGISVTEVESIVFPLAKEAGMSIGTVDKPTEIETDFSK